MAEGTAPVSAAAARPLLLAYRPLGLGDFLTGIPALRALARAHPGHRLVLCAPRALQPLAELSGAVDAVADTPALATPAPDLHGAVLAVNLHGRGPDSHRALLASRPQELIAFDCSEAGHAGPRWRPGEHEVARWCRLLSESRIAADASDLDLVPPAWPSPVPAAGATVIHPGAASAARRWPAERWAAVARSEREEGRAVLLTGSAAERPLTERVAALAGLGAGASLAGRTGLRELAAVVAAAGRVACGDTGVAHLATALGTPSVVLFGPTPPSAWGPPPDRPQHIVLWAGRSGDPHGETPDPGLLEIGVDDVTQALSALPERLASL